MNSVNKVYYIFSENLKSECNRLPAVLGRASKIHNLIEAYNLNQQLQYVTPKNATYEELKQFHSELYLEHLKTIKFVNEEYNITALDEEYGIAYDCPPVSNMYELVSTIAGGSITAAKCLVLGLTDVVINWCGGWHHAQRFAAEGFCYVNDIVLAIETLRKKYQKVLYIDLDVHHGNGVQDAYNLSKTVFTLSFHKYEPGFYPCSGSINEIGNLIGKGYCVNFPLHSGYSDDNFIRIFNETFTSVNDYFQPDAYVVQCGADALTGDPNGGANLTLKGYEACLRTVLDRRKPMMVLGGGGYNHANVARLWTHLTATILDVTLDNDIPDHEFFELYMPDCTLNIKPSFLRDMNKCEYLDKCLNEIKANLEKYLGTSCKNITQITNTNKREIKYQNETDKTETKDFINKENHDVYEFV